MINIISIKEFSQSNTSCIYIGKYVLKRTDQTITVEGKKVRPIFLSNLSAKTSKRIVLPNLPWKTKRSSQFTAQKIYKAMYII